MAERRRQEIEESRLMEGEAEERKERKKEGENELCRKLEACYAL